MYDASDVLTGIRNPKLLLREANQLFHSGFGRHEHNPDGIYIFEEDWDNLIILDSCRYDTFEEIADLPGRLEARTSRASATEEFVKANFTGRKLHDVVYVAGNSWYMKLREEIDSEVHALHDLHSTSEYTSDEFGVVLPETMTEYARQAAKRYPNKRLLIHYIQPHHPFIGPTGKEHFTHASSSLTEVIENAEESSRTLVERAYRENLELALSAVEDLLPALPGKTVISADHGEMLWDRHDYIPIREYGHPVGIWTETLTKVPWHVHVNGERKEIVPEAPEAVDSEPSAETVDERLSDLGYKM